MERKEESEIEKFKSASAVAATLVAGTLVLSSLLMSHFYGERKEIKEITPIEYLADLRVNDHSPEKVEYQITRYPQPTKVFQDNVAETTYLMFRSFTSESPIEALENRSKSLYKIIRLPLELMSELISPTKERIFRINE